MFAKKQASIEKNSRQTVSQDDTKLNASDAASNIKKGSCGLELCLIPCLGSCYGCYSCLQDCLCCMTRNCDDDCCKDRCCDNY